MSVEKEMEKAQAGLYICQNTKSLTTLPVGLAREGTLVRNGKTFELGKKEKSSDASATLILSKYFAPSQLVFLEPNVSSICL